MVILQKAQQLNKITSTLERPNKKSTFKNHYIYLDWSSCSCIVFVANWPNSSKMLGFTTKISIAHAQCVLQLLDIMEEKA